MRGRCWRRWRTATASLPTSPTLPFTFYSAVIIPPVGVSGKCAILLLFLPVQIPYRAGNFPQRHFGNVADSAAQDGQGFRGIKIDREATEMVERLTARMAREQGVTEELKASDEMKWVGLMNNIQAAAEEATLAELIYTDV